MAAQPPKMSGSTWGWLYDGRLWPVVLCSEAKVPDVFLATRKAPYATPAILLGKHVYIWVANHNLKELEPSSDYSDGLWEREGAGWTASDRADSLEKLRCSAFHVDLNHWGDDTYWTNYLLNEQEAKRLSLNMKASKVWQQPDVKRPVFEECDDDDHEPDSSPIGTKRPGAFIYDFPPTPEPTPQKRQKTSANQNTKRKSSTHEPAPESFIPDGPPPRDSVMDEEESSPEERRQENRRQTIARDNTYKDCTVFVGEEQIPFFISKANIDKCEYLSERVKFDAELRNHVYLDEDTDVNTNQFTPVFDYLTTGDFSPRLDRSRETAQLEGVFMEDSKLDAAAAVAGVYLTATKMHYGQLQDLCVEKLKTMQPLTLDSLLLLVELDRMAEALGTGVDRELRDWLVDNTAQRFMELLVMSGLTIARRLSDHANFREEVFKRLPLFKAQRLADLG